MKRITNLLQKCIKEQVFENEVLLAMIEVDWERTQKDTVVCVSNSWVDFITGAVETLHFHSVDKEDKFVAYRYGASSQTAKYTDSYSFCLPQDKHLELMESKNASTS